MILTKAMFNQLSDKLTATINRLKGVGRLTEKNIDDSLKSIRRALLDADVALRVTKEFIAAVRRQAVGQNITTKVRPGDALVKIVRDELTLILGDKRQDLILNAKPPIVMFMVGLQGSGKTTTTGKLARWLKHHHKKQVRVVSVDVYRPAAIDQLATVAEQIEVGVFPSRADQTPKVILKAAIDHATSHNDDILLVDTAGRLHIDEALMTELKQLHAFASPTETLLVVDSMAGQDAANMAQTFNESIPLTGIILTKVDGDARGGAALSMRMITEKPIKFVGVGEKLDALDVFHPDRIASRILGMGDILSLVEAAQEKVDKKKAERLAKKIKTGKRFDLEDFLNQLKQMKKLGGVQSLLSKLPIGAKLPKHAQSMVDEKLFAKMEAIIHSMTPSERQFPATLSGSRKQRIAKGSGTAIQDINQLLKLFTQMQKTLKRFKGDKLTRQLGNLQHQLPPELRDKLPKS